MMRILVISGSPWDSNNSFGNTFTNLFSGITDIEIAHLYCRYGMPDQSSIATTFFQITEKDILKKRPGRSFCVDEVPKNETKQEEQQEKGRYDFFRRWRFRIFFWARETLWKCGKWDTPELKKFVENFSPDLIYLAMYDSFYILNMGLWAKRITGANMVGLIADDYYTFRQFSLSPLFWIDRILKRKKIREVTSESEYLHVISEIQKEEYQVALHKECRIFRKSMEFDDMKRMCHENHSPIQYVYTGNLGSGRWESLSLIGQTIDQVCPNMAELFIYSQTPLTGKMERAFESCGSIRFMGNVSGEESALIQERADVLVLVESLKLKNRLATRISLSTKVVDYLHTGNCILSYGPEEQAGFRYLKENNAAVTASTPDELKLRIREMNPETIRRYGEAAWELGKKNHNSETVKKQFYQDLLDACGEK